MEKPSDFQAFQDPQRSLEDRLEAFWRVLTTPGPWPRGATLIEYATALAKYHINLELPGHTDEPRIDPHEISDIVLDIFFKKVSSIRDPDALLPWLSGVTRNVIREVIRKEGPLLFARGLSEDVVAPESEPNEADAADRGLRDSDYDALHDAVEKLPPHQRRVARLHLFEGMSHAEIARALGISDNAARQSWFRAKNQLMESLRKTRSKPT